MAPTDHTAPQQVQDKKEEPKGAKLNRKQRRAYNRMIEKFQSNFTHLTEKFVSQYFNLLAEDMDAESKDTVVTELFDGLDKNWRNFIKLELNKNLKHFRVTMDHRDKLLDRFSDFVSRFINRKELADMLDTEKVGVDKMKEGLKQLGIITQAKTVAGVQKRVDELSGEQKEDLITVLSGVS